MDFTFATVYIFYQVTAHSYVISIIVAQGLAAAPSLFLSVEQVGGGDVCACMRACVRVCVHKDLYPNSPISAMKGSLCSVTCAVRDTLLISHWKYYTKPVWYTKRVSQGAREPCINLRCPYDRLF